MEDVKTGNEGLDMYLKRTMPSTETEVAEPTEPEVEPTEPEVEAEVEEEIEVEGEEPLEEIEAEEGIDPEDSEAEEEEEDDFFIDLETDEVIDEAKPDEIVPDLSELSKALQIEGETQEDVVRAFETLKKEKEEALKQAETFSNVPDQLKKAVELAQEGGDYLEYLGVSSSENYVQNTSALDLYKQYLGQSEYFQNQENPAEALQDYIDSKNEVDIAMEAESYKKQLLANQQAQKEAVANEAREAKQRALAKTKEALNSMNDVHGVKVGPKAKQQILQDLQSGDFSRKLFYDTSGQPDYGKMARLAFINDNFEKIMDVMRKQATNDTKRKMIGQVANRTTRPGAPVTGQSGKDRALTSMDSAIDILKQSGGMPS